MEAATPLRKAQVRTAGDRLAIDGLVIDDECAVRLVRQRQEAGDDPVETVTDTIEIGARILDREQIGAGAELVKAELDKVSREVEASFTERAREVAEQFGNKVDEVFGPESGHLTKALERHFSDESSAAVQNRVKELLAETMARFREDLVRQFSSAEGSNPLADFKNSTIATLRQAGEIQDANLRALLEKMAALEKELQTLQAERGKLEELEAERERGTAKGRTFEELVVEAVDAVAQVQGDDCDAVGDVKGATGKTGDVVVSIDACRGPARGRIVFEAKDRRLSKPEALRELDRGLRERDADFAVLVVPAEERIPARMHPLREYNGDKMIVPFDPDGGSRLGLEVAYALARARVLMVRADGDEVDASAVRDTVERAVAAMEDVRRVKSQLTGATTSIENAEGILEEMAERVRTYLREIDTLVTSGS
jgi:hypothetical protein